MEFKQEADGNSGVFIRSFVEEKDVKVNGWQVEVAPKGFDTGGIYESYGRGWLIQIPDEKENILKQGEWNTMRIRVQGDNVQTWLNGERYHYGFWLQFYLYNDLKDLAERTNDKALASVIDKAYLQGKWELIK